MRVLVVDDHPLFRAGLAALIDADRRSELVGEASTGAEAVAKARELSPDVILMDLHLPDLSGIEATREIVAERPVVGVLILTMADDDEAVQAAIRAGARGYLLKESGPAEILSALHAVGEGTAVLGSAIAARVVTALARPQQPAGAFPQLTAREREILDLVARGRSNMTIAQCLVLSPKTVRNHISNIFAKLQVEGRSHAIVCAREAGLGV